MLQKCWRARYLPAWPSQVVLACTAFRVIIDLVCVTEVLACTVLARMAILGCVGVHSISGDHELVSITEVLACTVLAGMAITGCVVHATA